MESLVTPPEVLVFGSLNMDLMVRVTRAPNGGETIRGHGFMANPGGKGANQAVACARQGARVAMVGRVGSDAFGGALRAALEDDGVDTSRIRTAGGTSGIAIVMVEDSGENRISLVPGANALLAVEDHDFAFGPAVGSQLLLQCEVPMGAVVDAAALMRGRGARIVFNPAPVCTVPPELWRLVDWVVMNEGEASELAGIPVCSRETAAAAASAIRALGPGVAIVTLGGEGVVVVDAGGARHFPAIPVTVVDTTAAGDTFIGAMCAAAAAGDCLDDAVKRGIAAAAVCVSRPGAQVSIPRRDELPRD